MKIFFYFSNPAKKSKNSGQKMEKIQIIFVVKMEKKKFLNPFFIDGRSFYLLDKE